MANTIFEINNKKYVAREFDFNLVCDLEEMGVPLEQAQGKPMSMIRAYFGLCANLDSEQAGVEMQNHVLNGGGFNELSEIMGKKMNESDFFLKINETTKETTPKRVTKTTTKK